jgi:hypothetical protein
MLLAAEKVGEGIRLVEIGKTLQDPKCCFVLGCYYLEIADRECSFQEMRVAERV